MSIFALQQSDPVYTHTHTHTHILFLTLPSVSVSSQVTMYCSLCYTAVYPHVKNADIAGNHLPLIESGTLKLAEEGVKDSLGF